MHFSTWTFKQRMLVIAALAIVPILLVILIFNFSIHGPIQEQLLHDTAGGIRTQMRSVNAQVNQIETYANTMADTTDAANVPTDLTKVPATQRGLDRLINQLFLLQNDSELIQSAQILVTGAHPYVINATGTSLTTANLVKLCGQRTTRTWVPQAATLNLVQPLANFPKRTYLIVTIANQALLARYQASVAKHFTYLQLADQTIGTAPKHATSSWPDAKTVLIGNVRYQITRQQASHLGTVWSYYSLFSLDATFESISRVSLNIAIVSIIAVALTLGLIYLIRSSFYTPVTTLLQMAGTPPEAGGDPQNELYYLQTKWQQLLSDRTALTQAAKQNHSRIANNFWHQAIQGQLAYLTLDELTSQAAQLGLALSEQHPLRFIRLTLSTRIPQPHAPQAGDAVLDQFMFANVVSDLAEAHFDEYYLLESQADTALLLVSDLKQAGIEAFIQLASDSLNQLLGRYLTVYVGRKLTRFNALGRAYEDMNNAAGLQRLTPSNQHFFLANTAPLPQAPLLDVTEAAVLDAVRQGETAAANAHLTALLTPYFTAALPQRLLFVAIEKLYFDLSSLLQGYGIDTALLPSMTQLRHKLQPLLTQADVSALLTQQLLTPAMRVMTAHQQQGGRQKLTLILAYLKEHYADPQLSLEQTAEQYAIDSYTLSRLFKQATGVTYTDYLTDLRLNAAKSALRQTDQRVADIATACGYQPSYFNRLFKKHVGVTPGQYRKQA